jgi:hypothetical protein
MMSPNVLSILTSSKEREREDDGLSIRIKPFISLSLLSGIRVVI